MSNKPMRWFFPPPQATAYFSNRRQPGVVLRVSRIFALVPRTASTNCAVKVATPESRWTKFSATRSALKMARAGPEISSKISPALTRRPSGTQCSMRISEGRVSRVPDLTILEIWHSWNSSLRKYLVATSRNAISANSIPATTSGSRARMTACVVDFSAPSPASSRRRRRCPRRARLERPGGFLWRTIPRRKDGGERKRGKAKIPPPDDAKIEPEIVMA